MIRPSVKVEQKGKAEWDRYVGRFKKMNDAYVTVGFHEDAGRYPGPNAPLVVEVALWNEFGTEQNPARPFMAIAIDSHVAAINRWREEAIEKILDEGWTVQKALEMMGLRIQVLIQNQIKANTPPPNAPSTVKKKQAAGVLPQKFKGGTDRQGRLWSDRTKTLINTGLMLRSVTYKVFVGGAK